MANVQRLTKRVKDLEEWIKENEMTGGPQGTLEVFTFLVNEARGTAQRKSQTDQAFHQLRQLTFEFVKQHNLTEEWDEFVQETEDAVQKQATEEVPTLAEAEDGEEVGKEDSEGSETSKESKDEPKEETKD
jgi:predicted dehydrogenase